MSKLVEEQKWYVVFCDSDEITYPFKLFTRKNFEHCFCFSQSPAGVIVLNYTSYNCEARFASGKSAEDYAIEFHNTGANVLRIITSGDNNFILRGFIYCVTLTKTFLGLRKCFAITPFGLYKWLKREGKNGKLAVLDFSDVLK